MNATRICSIDGCEKKVLARGWCRTHYTRWYETGSTELGVRLGIQPPRASLEERFWPKVDKGDGSGCWLWTSGKTRLGYGTIWDNRTKKHAMAHRISYELHHGTIDPNLVIDHLCRTPSCVRPDHLELVTVAENTRRGLAPLRGSMFNRIKTQCPQGHEYSESNTYRYVTESGNRRVCRTCAIERTQARRRRIKEMGK